MRLCYQIKYGMILLRPVDQVHKQGQGQVPYEPKTWLVPRKSKARSRSKALEIAQLVEMCNAYGFILGRVAQRLGLCLNLNEFLLGRVS
jgi:hypothetical protein